MFGQALECASDNFSAPLVKTSVRWVNFLKAYFDKAQDASGIGRSYSTSFSSLDDQTALKNSLCLSF